ncbi:hypothetical protein L1887_29273 [Cichorium endivia]|nr:hypothetical protein L1887_29273 [Cichorium endivia]
MTATVAIEDDDDSSEREGWQHWKSNTVKHGGERRRNGGTLPVVIVEAEQGVTGVAATNRVVVLEKGADSRSKER